MANKKRKFAVFFIIAVVIIIAVIILFGSFKKNETASFTKQTINPAYGTISTYVSTTGTVYPQNRVEILPPIAGRVEKILVNEGDKVKAGQTIVWMSSTERAALIDAARQQGEAQVKYWEGVYKSLPVVAPISGTIIARSLEPGQTATTSTVILVISDRLYVKANVDETDVGRIKTGQLSEISLDAYPDVKVNGRVHFIKYESTTTNNVTTYEVGITPDNIPAIFKSGMSANIKIYDNIRKNVLTLPLEAIKSENGNPFVYVSDPASGDGLKRIQVKTGLEDEQNVEIVSGITENSNVVVMQQNYIPKTDDSTGTSPFMQGPRNRSSSSKSGSSSQGGGQGGPPPM